MVCGCLVAGINIRRGLLACADRYAKTKTFDGFFDVADLSGRIRRQRQFKLFCGEVQPNIDNAWHACQSRFNFSNTTCTIHAFRSEEHTSELPSLMRISYAVI